MQVVIFEELGAVLRRQHKNVKEEKKRELKISASHTKSITEIFAAQTKGPFGFRPSNLDACQQEYLLR